MHSAIFLQCQIKNACTKNGWNGQIPLPAWIKPAGIKILLQAGDRFQNNYENIDKVYQSGSFYCIINLTYGITFLCNVFQQVHYTTKYPVRYSFLQKTCKVVYYFFKSRTYQLCRNRSPFVAYNMGNVRMAAVPGRVLSLLEKEKL